MSTVTYTVPAINCKHCIHTISTELGDLAGIKSVQADLDSKRVVVSYEPPATTEKIETLLAEINYPPAK